MRALAVERAPDAAGAWPKLSGQWRIGDSGRRGSEWYLHGHSSRQIHTEDGPVSVVLPQRSGAGSGRCQWWTTPSAAVVVRITPGLSLPSRCSSGCRDRSAVRPWKRRHGTVSKSTQRLSSAMKASTVPC